MKATPKVTEFSNMSLEQGRELQTFGTLIEGFCAEGAVHALSLLLL